MPQLAMRKPKVDIDTALALKIAGKSYQQIADKMGCCKQAVQKQIKSLLPDDDTQTYKQQRADILAKLQLKLLAEVDDDRLKKAPAGSLILAACQLYDKERLERGQSTSNTLSIVADLDKIREAADKGEIEI